MAAATVDTVEIATQAAEAAAGIAGIVANFKLLELAKDYYDLYNEQRQFYYSTFQAGVEAPLANEVYFLPRYNRNYSGRVSTAYNSVTGPLGGSSTDALGWWTRHAATYNTPIDPNLEISLKADMARLRSDWTNYLFRFEEHYADTTNDIRWRKRILLHNLGIKQGAAVAGALDESLGQYQQHLSDFSSQMATYGNGIARYVGYKKGLADTADDFDSVSYTRSPQPVGVPDFNYVTVDRGEKVV